MAREHLLDTTDMEPPEPLVRTLELVEGLEAGDYLRFRHRREPHLLYDNLKQLGFSFITCIGNDVAYEVFIWREDDTEAQSATISQIQTGKLTIQSSSMNKPDP